MYDISLRGIRFPGVALSGSPRLMVVSAGKEDLWLRVSVSEHEGEQDRRAVENRKCIHNDVVVSITLRAFLSRSRLLGPGMFF
jgi:hypothetical protein